MPRVLSPVLAAALLTGCGKNPPAPPAPPPPPPATSPGPTATPDAPPKKAGESVTRVTSEELTADWSKDADTARTKRPGVLEVTGPFDNVRERLSGGVKVSLWGAKDPSSTPDRPVLAVMDCEFTADEFRAEPRLWSLSRGQSVTIAGTIGAGSWLALGGCRLVKAGPCTAVPTTLREIEESLGKPGGRDRYDDKDALLRVKLQDPKPAAAALASGWPLVPPAGGKTRFTLRAATTDDLGRKRLGEAKPGDTVVVLADVGPLIGNGITLDQARVLDAVPEGVKLPEDK